MIHRLVHRYKYVQSRVIILQQHVSATSVNIIRVAYNKNTINKQLKCMLKPLGATLDFVYRSLWL